MVGIDCATKPKKVGLARVTVVDGTARVDELGTASSWPAIEDKVVSWLSGRTLLALDAPLGWPRALGEVLQGHHAGGGVDAEPDAMFRRDTDHVVERQVGKRSLDVGADRIARTAHAALSFLQRLRELTGLAIPLAWEPGRIDGTTVIEVYPAATLASRRLPDSGYKKSTEAAAEIRRDLVAALSQEVQLDDSAKDSMQRNDHVLDAVVCALAGFDFLTGSVVRPQDSALAQREGWIWVRLMQT